MRILQYNLTTTTKRGGVETFVWELSYALAQRDHHVTIFGGADPQTGDQVMGRFRAGMQVERVPFVDRTLFQRIPPLKRRYAEVKLLERLSMIPSALPLMRGYDIVHIHKPYDMVLAPLWKAMGSKVVLHSHGEDFYLSDKLFVRAIDQIVSCSQFNADYTGQRYNKTPTVVYNGFDKNHFRPQSPDLALRDSLVPRDHKVLLCVARLIPWKGIDDIIAAVAYLPANTTLLVAGTGHYRPTLEKKAQELGLSERVRFLGDIPNRELPRYFALADLVVAASHASETFGMVLCEAMGCARPIVATRFGGFPEVVEDGVTGLLVPPRDPVGLAAAIAQLLADPERAARFGAAGRERVLRLFTWEAVTDRVEAVYRSL
jgi:D-inositol-3-phosphate glycosyltransferase